MANVTAENREAAFMQRDAAMMLLIAQAQGLVQQLALLAGSEKAAVAGLVAVGQALAVYAQADRPDAEAMASFDSVLASLSPVMARRIASIRSAAPESAEATAEITGLTRSLKGLLAALALPASGSAPPAGEDTTRMAGDQRSLLPHR